MKINNIIISTTEGSDDGLGRTADINLKSRTGVVHLGADFADGGGTIDTSGDATVYPNTAKTEVLPATPKHAFMVDPDFADRFIHVASAKSTMTFRYVDFFYDAKLHILFVIDDLNIFDKDGEVDAGSHSEITGMAIMVNAHIGDSFDNVSGGDVYPTREGIKITAPVATTTHLIYMSGVSNMMTIYNSGLVISDEFYLEGNNGSCAQFVSLGKSSDIFNGPIPFFRLTHGSAFSKMEFRFAGIKDAKDICIPLNF